MLWVKAAFWRLGAGATSLSPQTPQVETDATRCGTVGLGKPGCPSPSIESPHNTLQEARNPATPSVETGAATIAAQGLAPMHPGHAAPPSDSSISPTLDLLDLHTYTVPAAEIETQTGADALLPDAQALQVSRQSTAKAARDAAIKAKRHTCQPENIQAQGGAESCCAWSPVHLAEWLRQGGPEEVVDYNAETDRLLLVWDDRTARAANLRLAVCEDPHDAEVKHITMNGRRVAEVYGAPDLQPGDITVIPLSGVSRIGFEPTGSA